MNTYIKFVPNVFLAKCSEKHEKGETILIETRYGKEHECIVFNPMGEKDGFYFYSVARADGFNVQEWAKRKAERLEGAAMNAEKKSHAYWEASHEGKDFLALGEPIKVGHHSEKRHRALIERNWNRMDKCVELSKKAEEYESRVAYWANKAETINLSMPESLEFYEFELEKAKAKHEGLKNGSIPRLHSFSLTYAKKEVNEIESKLKIARRMWA
jgi:hypothetical protein